MEDTSHEAAVALENTAAYNRQHAHDLIDSVTDLQSKLSSETHNSSDRLTKMEQRMNKSFLALGSSLNEATGEREDMQMRVQTRMQEVINQVNADLATERASRLQKQEQIMNVLENFVNLST